MLNKCFFFEEITKWIDEESAVDIIYLDFQKAFDKVPHQRLLLILKAHGNKDGIIDWIEQWLTDRRQRVVVDGEVSNWKSVLSGVPQRSVYLRRAGYTSTKFELWNGLYFAFQNQSLKPHCYCTLRVSKIWLLAVEVLRNPGQKPL